MFYDGFCMHNVARARAYRTHVHTHAPAEIDVDGVNRLIYLGL